MPDLGDQSDADLLALHAAITEELRNRKVVRSANNPTGNLAEFRLCKALGWQQVANPVKGYDATGNNGLRYQIKGRRMHRPNTPPQHIAAAIRDLDVFDVLAAILFEHDYRVMRAALIPASVARDLCRAYQ